MVIKTSKGDVYLKPFCTRKIKKGIEALIYKDVKVGVDGKPEFLAMSNFDLAADYKVLNMIEKIAINEQEIQPTAEFLDNLDVRDFDKISAAVDKIIKGEDPKE